MEETSCNSTWSDRKNILLIASGCVASVSCIMCVIAITAVFCLKLHTRFTYRLALYQVLSGMLFSIGIILFFGTINYDDDNLAYVIVCKAQAVLTQCFLLVKIMFTMSLIFHLFCFTVFLKNFKKLEPLYVISSIVVPLGVSWIPFIHDNYGVVGAWCWIQGWKQSDNCTTEHFVEGVIEQFTLMYGPLFVCLVVGTIMSIVIIVVLLWRVCGKLISRPHHKLLVDSKNITGKQNEMLKQLLPLVAYPLIFCCITFLPIVHRVWEAVDHAPYALTLVHCTMNSSMGFFSGSVLIIHILVVQSYEKKKLRAKQAPRLQHAVSETDVPTIHNLDFLTTNNHTTFLIPAESEVDAAIEGHSRTRVTW